MRTRSTRAPARRCGHATRRSTATTPSPSARANPSSLSPSFSCSYPRSAQQTRVREPCARADLRRPFFADPDRDPHVHRFRYVRIASRRTPILCPLLPGSVTATSTDASDSSTASTSDTSDNPDFTAVSGSCRVEVTRTSWVSLFVAGWVLVH